MLNLTLVPESGLEVEAPKRGKRSALGYCISWFQLAEGHSVPAQLAVMTVGCGIVVPAFAIDISVAIAKLMLWLNRQSKHLAGLVERTGVFFGALAIMATTAVIVYTLGPVKEITRTVIEPAAAAQPAQESTNPGN